MTRFQFGFIAIISIVVTQVTFGQNVMILDSLNGYKEFKLGGALKSDSNNLACSNFFSELDELKLTTSSPDFSAHCFVPKNQSIGGLKVLNIHVVSYKSIIIRIIVNTEPGEKMALLINELFGNSSECDNFVDSDPILRKSETCVWKGKNVYLKYCNYFPMKGPVVTKIPEPWMKYGFNSLTFTSPLLFQQIIADAKKAAKQSKKDF